MRSFSFAEVGAAIARRLGQGPVQSWSVEDAGHPLTDLPVHDGPAGGTRPARFTSVEEVDLFVAKLAP
jgi:hypothetical protein